MPVHYLPGNRQAAALVRRMGGELTMQGDFSVAITQNLPTNARERAAHSGWGPLAVVLTGTFMTFLDYSRT
jgi:hypothetical protein